VLLIRLLDELDDLFDLLGVDSTQVLVNQGPWFVVPAGVLDLLSLNVSWVT
jgi:hypothetical protein